jgi:hypothetical protein
MSKIFTPTHQYVAILQGSDYGTRSHEPISMPGIIDNLQPHSAQQQTFERSGRVFRRFSPATLKRCCGVEKKKSAILSGLSWQNEDFELDQSHQRDERHLSAFSG